MATYVEQGRTSPTDEPTVFSARDVVVYTLTSAANGTALTGTGQTLVVSSDSAGWFYVSTSANTDKAAVGKKHRIFANVARPVGGVSKGDFISFLADA